MHASCVEAGLLAVCLVVCVLGQVPHQDEMGFSYQLILCFLWNVLGYRALHNSCTSCIETASQCSWCPFTFQCIASSFESCNGNGEETPITDSCPRLLPPENSSNYLLHTNYMYEAKSLIIRAENLENFQKLFKKKQFQCVVTTTEGIELFRIEAVLGGEPLGSEVECRQRQFNYDYNSDESEVNAILKVEWTTASLAIDNPSRTGVTLYSCARLGTNCAQCLSLDANYQCRVCDRANRPCSIEPQCSGPFINDPINCGIPVISSISPNSGPLEGGTTITVMGSNLGVTRSDIVKVTINDVSCYVNDQSYQPGISFTCVTGPTTNGSYGIVAKISYLVDRILSEDTVKFSYKDPSIDSVVPNTGPRAGGILVTIRGSNLDVGSSLSVWLVDIPCDIINSDGSQICCTSGSLGDVNPIRTGLVEVVIDNAVVSNGIEFEFRDDPVYTAVSPQRVIPAGGIKVTLTGTNLDVVAQPVFIFDDVRISNSEGEPCTATKTEMICVIPPFEVNGLPSNISYTIQVGAAPGPDLTDERLTLDVKPNPVFAEDGSAIDEGESGLLMIRGTNLDSVEREEIVVTVGGEVCIETSSDDVNTYVCSQPSQLPSGLSEALQVVVYVGQNLRYNIRPPTTTSTPSSTIAAVVGLGISVGLSLFIAMVILLMAIIIIRRRRRLRTSYVTKLMEMPRIEVHAAAPDTMEMAQNQLINKLPQKFHIPSSQIHLLNSIGHGEFGEVYKARLTRGQGGVTHIVAVKTLRGLFTATDVQVMLQEVVKMKDLNHPHIIPLIGVCLDAGVGVVMPYMANGSVLSYLKKERKTLLLQDEADVEQIVPARKMLLRMCLQIARGMEYLAQQKFVHRDLAARNCMLDHKGNVKVGDFGLAEDIYARGYVREDSKTVKVPYKWMSPESLEDGLFSQHSDVWSYGVTCWEIFTAGKTPYPALDPPTLLKMVRDGHRLESPDNLAYVPEMYVLMKKCWRLSPSERPCFSELMVRLDKMLMSVADNSELSMTLVEAEDEEDWLQYDEVDDVAMMADEINVVKPNSCYGVRRDQENRMEPNPAMLWNKD